MVSAAEKYASEIENLYFQQRLPDSDFTWQRAKKTLSPVSLLAVSENRLFQQNQPLAGIEWHVMAHGLPHFCPTGTDDSTEKCAN